MSAIACNAEAGAKGVFDFVSRGQDSFKEQISEALALKLNLKTTQQANERSLANLLKSKNTRGDFKQVLQARAAVYGQTLDPAFFGKGVDLSSKLKTLGERRIARSTLIGGPLLTAQLGHHDVRQLLMKGMRLY